MRLHNPHATAAGRGNRVETLKAELDTHLRSNTTKRVLTFDEVRARVGPEDLTDGEIHQAAQDLGLELER